MERYRVLRKWGNTWVICLTASDVKDFKITKPCEADISDITIRKKHKKSHSTNAIVSGNKTQVRNLQKSRSNKLKTKKREKFSLS